jgi:flavin-binding protein dodecin
MQERGYGDLLERVQAAWLAAAEQALARNASTVAVLSIDEILKPDGYVARLRQKGYAIEDP